MNRMISSLAMLALLGLVVAILRAFDYDLIAAMSWVFSWMWEMITKVADIWSGNDAFKKVTRKP